jgi:hypothetical protein
MRSAGSEAGNGPQRDRRDGSAIQPHPIDEPADEQSAQCISDGEDREQQTVVGIREGKLRMRAPDVDHGGEDLAIEVIQDRGENENADRDPTGGDGRAHMVIVDAIRCRTLVDCALSRIGLDCQGQ